jgi:hypothetical protein
MTTELTFSRHRGRPPRRWDNIVYRLTILMIAGARRLPATEPLGNACSIRSKSWSLKKTSAAPVAEKSATQRTVSHECDAEFTNYRQQIVFGFTTEQRVIYGESLGTNEDAVCIRDGGDAHGAKT